MDDLVQWLRDRLDEDERIARAVGEERWQPHYVDSVNDQPDTATVRVAGGADVAVMERYSYQDAEHIATHDPARVLREIDAKRRLIADYTKETRTMGRGHRTGWAEGGQAVRERLIKVWAAIYDERPGYREEWRP